MIKYFLINLQEEEKIYTNRYENGSSTYSLVIIQQTIYSLLYIKNLLQKIQFRTLECIQFFVKECSHWLFPGSINLIFLLSHR